MKGQQAIIEIVIRIADTPFDIILAALIQDLATPKRTVRVVHWWRPIAYFLADLSYARLTFEKPSPVLDLLL